jgi:hypothetical protein
MERFTIDVSLPNMITIGLFGALWFLIIVGGYSVWKNTTGAGASA